MAPKGLPGPWKTGGPAAANPGGRQWGPPPQARPEKNPRQREGGRGPPKASSKAGAAPPIPWAGGEGGPPNRVVPPRGKKGKNPVSPFEEKQTPYSEGPFWSKNPASCSRPRLAENPVCGPPKGAQTRGDSPTPLLGPFGLPFLGAPWGPGGPLGGTPFPPGRPAPSPQGGGGFRATPRS